MQNKQKQFAISGFFLLLMLLFTLWNPLSSLQFMLSDFFCQHSGKPSSDIYVIGIDEKTLQALGPWNSWPRSTMAELIEILNADVNSAPSVIGIDVMYFGETASDTALIEAASKHHNLVFASQLQFSSALQQAGNGSYHLNALAVQGIELPQAPLQLLAGHGFTNVFLDSDGFVRRSMLTASYQGTSYDSFPYAVYKKYTAANNLPSAPSRTDKNGMWTIPYSASPGVYQQGISFLDVLEGRIPASFFQNSIVLIGAASSGMMDSYLTPLSRSTPMYGVEINANMVQALLQRKSIAEVPLFLQLFVTAVLFLLVNYVLGKQETILKLTALLASTLGWFAFAALSAKAGYLWNILYLPLFSVLYYSYRTVRDYLTERKARLLTRQTFERYVSPEVAQHLLSSHQDGLAAMREARRHIAVLFVDIRGFTPLSESLEPEEVTDILNQYLTLTANAVFSNHGTVDKFIGDATMALFNAPDDLEDYVYLAVKTALDIRDGGSALRETLAAKYGKEVQFGIGVHCGEAIVGSIGAPFRMDYTAIGDTVNTAARLESNAGPGQVLVSKEVYHALEGRMTALFLGTRTLKGKAKPVEIYEVLSLE